MLNGSLGWFDSFSKLNCVCGYVRKGLNKSEGERGKRNVFFYKAPNVPSILVGSKDFFVPPEAVLDYVFFQVLPLLCQAQIPFHEKTFKIRFFNH